MITLVVLAMAVGLAGHAEGLLRAASRLAGTGLVLALCLCVVHRALNATGWGMVLRATDQSVDTVAAARLWLASEACRWLPGSVWAYGSRTLLASRCGVPVGRVAASLVLELLATVAGWLAVAALGWGHLRIPGFHPSDGTPTADATSHVTSRYVAIAVAGALAVLYLASRSSRLRSRLSSLTAQLLALRRMRLDLRQLGTASLFYAAMGVMSGVALVIVIRSEPNGSAVPAQAAIAANAVAWLVGFFALFAPGGLVVREACLATLLSPWMPLESALVVSLAWRLVQIVAEILCSIVVATWGLPRFLARDGAPGDGLP
jgi:hypothetical protein